MLIMGMMVLHSDDCLEFARWLDILCLQVFVMYRCWQFDRWMCAGDTGVVVRAKTRCMDHERASASRDFTTPHAIGIGAQPLACQHTYSLTFSILSIFEAHFGYSFVGFVH